MPRKNDIYCGIALMAAGVWIAWEASGFPALAGMPYGAGLFPMIAAIGMSLCGVLILLFYVLATIGSANTSKAAKRVKIEKRALFNVCCVLATVILYALLLEPLGFHLVSFLALFFLFAILQVRWFFSLILAIVVTIGIHFIFYSLLHVPLPWGILEPLAW